MSVAESWQALEDDLCGPEPDYEAPPVEIPDLAEANRELARLARVRRQRATDREIAEAQIAQVEKWLEARDAHHQARAEYHLERLRHFHEAALTLDPTAKTLSLPNGTLRARALQPEWDFDEDKFLPWAFENMTDAVRLRAPEVDKAAAKAQLTRRDEKGRAVAYGITDDGETPPGVTVTERGLSFIVELAEEG
jgi:hypothetical protein